MRLGVPHDEIGVEPDTQLALPVLQPGVPRSADREPVDEPVDPDAAAPPGLGPEQTEAEAEGADAAPGGHDVAVAVRVRALEGGEAGAVVADDGVEGAVEEGGPEGVAVGVVADGRAALEVGAAGGDVRGGEDEVVEAGLDCEREAGGAGGADEGERGGGGEVDDVQAERGVGGVELGYERDGGDFEGGRARGEECCVLGRVCLFCGVGGRG